MPDSYIQIGSEGPEDNSSNISLSATHKIMNANSCEHFISEEKKFFIAHLQCSALLYIEAYKNSYPIFPKSESKIKSRINQACLKSLRIVFDILDEHLRSLSSIENNLLSDEFKIALHKELIIRAHRTMMEEVMRHTQVCLITDNVRDIRPIYGDEDALKYIIHVFDGEPIPFIERMISTIFGIPGAILGFIFFPIAIGCAIYSYQDNLNRSRYAFNKNFQSSTSEVYTNIDTNKEKEVESMGEEPSHKNFNSLNALHESRKFSMKRGINIKDPSTSSDIHYSSNNDGNSPL